VRSTPWQLPEGDLSDSVLHSATDLEHWRGSRVLITGGTGFLGGWLVASLIRANQMFDLELEVDLVTRSPRNVPSSVRSEVRIVDSDVSTMTSTVGEYPLIVHGAASSAASYGRGDGDPRQMIRTILDGTKAALEVAARTRARVLFLSSGAVYGQQLRPEVAEDDTNGPEVLNPRMAYGEAKRMAETLCAVATEAGEAVVSMARLFAFVGPRIPLDGHFAAGNFLADALAGRPIRVAGDGTAIRTYLYCGDLPEWCWAIATRGRPGAAYNVGSSAPISIAVLAELIGGLASPALPVRILGEAAPGPVNRYVPSTELASTELGLVPRTDLPTAFGKSLRWLENRS
jgi:nucleoside-diphosphate-sugar epimerase